MKLKLEDYKLVDLKFTLLEKDSVVSDTSDNLNLQVGQFYGLDDECSFGIGFKVNFVKENYSIDMEMRFFFVADEPITEEFKNSSFPMVNAPAIAFPYLRSFISIFTMQSGFAPVLIPSINFVELAKNNSN